MPIFSTRLRYGTVAQAFHWLTVLLVGAAYLIEPERGEGRAASADLATQLHETLGLLVFAAVLLRLLWRFLDQAPDSPPMRTSIKIASRAVHLALYGLLLALPSLGLLGTWLEGHPVALVGLGNVGPLLAAEPEFGEVLSELHETLGNVIIWLAGLHAAAALFHHYVLHDRVLVAMLPVRRSQGSRGA
jgi:cytochrome b561